LPTVRRVLSQRVFPLLQLTRMALVFTAISNSLCTLLLMTRRLHPGPWSLELLSWRRVLLVIAISTGLYSFGMSLNDIIDRRRDRELAAHRPLPSGRIGVAAAHLACALFGILALFAAALYTRFYSASPMPLILVVFTGLLITFYDFAGKYLVALGLLTLGLIRFFHAIIPAPGIPLLWHPLLLLNHTTILSLVAYKWEQKRPPLTRVHWWTVLGGLALADALLIGLYAARAQLHHQPSPASIIAALWIRRALIAPLAAALVFVLLGIFIRRRLRERQAGQVLMLYGLLWLIVYDVAFVAGYVDLLTATALLLLLPLAYGSVQIMRWWARILSLSQRPQFRRAVE
jgi:hypothetical protein